MSRFPIRLRLTAAFALGMIAVLAGAGLFTYLWVRNDLEETINEDLHTRAEVVIGLARQAPAGRPRLGPAPLEQPDERFSQILAPDGRVLDSTRNVRSPVLTRSELGRAAVASLTLERRVPRIEVVTRVLAEPVSRRPGSAVVVVGQSLGDRNETLGRLIDAFAIPGPIAVVLASLLGYLLAAAGLSPVEAMRRRAGQVSLTQGGEQLPLPAAHDEIRRLGETLNDMLDRLRGAFERERRFVADAGHELRTPVAVLKTEIEGALRTGDYGPGVRDALVAAAEECDHLAQLADDLLVVARSADGQLPVQSEKLRVRPVLESVRDRFSDRAGQHGRSIQVDADGAQAVRADPLRLRQALGNLVDNALRHGQGEIAITARRAGDGVEIDVSDQGTGFATELTAHAFERFTRGDRARTRGGAGLGMAIVRAIAEAHGGTATIAEGGGAVVRLWLPDRPPSPTG